MQSQHSVPFAWITLIILAATAVSEPGAEPFTDAEIKAAKRRRDSEVAAVQDELDVAEEQRRIAVQRRAADKAKELGGRISTLKKEVRRLQKTSVEHYAEVIRGEEALGRAEQQQKAKEEALRKVLPPMNELEMCGPLAIHDCQMIKNSIQAELITLGPLEWSRLGLNQFSGFPILIVRVIATGDKPVESYEVSFEVTDSFGKPVENRRSGETFTEQETLTKPLTKGQIDTAMNWGEQHYKQAFMAKVWISKVRLADGTMWEQTREEAMGRKHAMRESERVDVWQARECKDSR
jgi:hypothetical protein